MRLQFACGVFLMQYWRFIPFNYCLIVKKGRIFNNYHQ